MQPTRRRCLAVAGVGIGVGVAGCLSSGSNITYPEPQPDDNSGGSSEDNPEEPEPDPVENINTRLADETTSIYEELRWFETQYDDAISQYQSRIREVVESLKFLLDTLEQEGRIEATELEDVKSFADEVAIDLNGMLEPQFTDQYNFWAVNRNRFPTVEKFRKREDWDRVKSELEAIRSAYRGASTSEELRSRHSPNPIDNRLYGRFGGDGSQMFEVRYVSDEDGHHQSTTNRQLPGYGVYVINDASREVNFLSSAIGRAPRNVLPSMDTTFAPFEASTDRSYRLYVQVHDVGTGGNIDPTENTRMGVYGQKYADLAAADAALESVMADKQLEDTVEWGSETWNRVIYTRDDERTYAYVIRAGSFLYAVGPSRTAWEEREDNWDALLTGTWVRP
jgi:hypothetical protein